MGADNNIDVLFNVTQNTLKADEPTNIYFEQYKIYLEILDKLADRRQATNSFFLTLNTGLCAAFAFLYSNDVVQKIRILDFIIPIAGIVVSYFWYRLVISYRQLSTAKFEVIHKIEQYLPIALFKAEWIKLGYGNDPKTYKPLTQVEVWVPILFIIMYMALLCYLLPWINILNSIKATSR